jgi:hypothetical protein
MVLAVNLKEIQAFRSVSFIAIVAVIATPIERRRNRFYDRLGSPCDPRDINTPEVRDALDLLEPHIKPEWLIPQFRYHVQRYGQQHWWELEAQQQVLCAIFPRIRESVKELIEKQMDALARNFAATHDMKVKDEINLLAKEYGKLGEPWRFVAG